MKRCNQTSNWSLMGSGNGVLMLATSNSDGTEVERCVTKKFHDRVEGQSQFSTATENFIRVRNMKSYIFCIMHVDLSFI